jgi:hypothetical protein
MELFNGRLTEVESQPELRHIEFPFWSTRELLCAVSRKCLKRSPHLLQLNENGHHMEFFNGLSGAAFEDELWRES